MVANLTATGKLSNLAHINDSLRNFVANHLSYYFIPTDLEAERHLTVPGQSDALKFIPVSNAKPTRSLHACDMALILCVPVIFPSITS